MKEVNDLILPADLRYTKDHEWAKVVDGNVRIGLDDYAQDQLGDIVFAELPEIGAKLSKGGEFATVESTKAVSECYMPVSGEVVKVNEALLDNPQLINESCYDEGWMIEVKPDDLSEMDQLMDSEQCRASAGEH